MNNGRSGVLRGGIDPEAKAEKTRKWRDAVLSKVERGAVWHGMHGILYDACYGIAGPTLKLP